MCVIWVIKDCLKPCFRIYCKLFSLDAVGETGVTRDNSAEDVTDTNVEPTTVDATEDLEDVSDSEVKSKEEQPGDKIEEELSPGEGDPMAPAESPDVPVPKADNNSNHEGDK